MLSDPQASAHRALPPTRFKARWQPYPSQIIGSTSDMNTPKPSVPQSPPPSATPLHATPLHHPHQLPKEPVQRDVGKQKYALGLIDQAVKTLSEIWRPEDIPCVFVGPTKGPNSNSLSPSLQPLVSTGPEMENALLPLKNFVHEVLKRSRTSGSIMQAALCYLEAIRPKMPQIVLDEKLGIRSFFMPESAILPATDAELRMHRMLEESDSSDECLKIRRTDEESDVISDTLSMVPEPTVVHISSASPLPSPLLCPRRTFLAALILAAKFSQDKCYSNRAWAKLSGLPPREIGRCERALGQALDWRLWVGKKASFGVSCPSRSVVRTQSESCINSLPSLRESPLRSSTSNSDQPSCLNRDASSMASSSWTGKGLRRCATLPAEPFTGPPSRLDSVVDESQKDVCWALVPCSSSDSISSGSSTSSPETPPLTYSPSTSGDRTVQISSYEDGGFPNACQSGDIDLKYSRFPLSDSPPFSDPHDSKLCISNTGNTEAKVTAMLAETISKSLWSSRFGVVADSHLWHADGGHLSLESTSVH